MNDPPNKLAEFTANERTGIIWLPAYPFMLEFEGEGVKSKRR